METTASIKSLAERLAGISVRDPLRLMEVCGTHTVAIRRHGIHHALPEKVKLLSGPGCPVCVTSDRTIDEAVFLARNGYLLATFGDMMRVPGSISSLQQERAAGAEIVVVYSPLEALDLAQQRDKPVVFLAVGFETTIPAIAVTIEEARSRKIRNFSILPSLRLIPPALQALIAGQSSIDGLLLPGHVSAIIGVEAYRFLQKIPLPAVISGFQPEEILSSLILLVEMSAGREPSLINNYPAVVRQRGNPKSRRIMENFFAPCDIEWRGLGRIAQSGLALRPPYDEWDIHSRVNIPVEHVPADASCCCGEVLQGKIDPPDCPLYLRGCTPETPRGACMVSSEGSCHAWTRYG